jgi:hypothetical protein
MADLRNCIALNFSSLRRLFLRRKKNATMKPRKAKATRPPAIPPATAPVLIPPDWDTGVSLALIVAAAAAVLLVRLIVLKELVCGTVGTKVVEVELEVLRGADEVEDVVELVVLAEEEVKEEDWVELVEEEVAELEELELEVAELEVVEGGTGLGVVGTEGSGLVLSSEGAGGCAEGVVEGAGAEGEETPELEADEGESSEPAPLPLGGS